MSFRRALPRTVHRASRRRSKCCPSLLLRDRRPAATSPWAEMSRGMDRVSSGSFLMAAGVGISTSVRSRELLKLRKMVFNHALTEDGSINIPWSRWRGLKRTRCSSGSSFRLVKTVQLLLQLQFKTMQIQVMEPDKNQNPRAAIILRRGCWSADMETRAQCTL